ncbi:interferon-induced protein 44-like, partial [Notolabrus celidotus]|uniref:interferon-induced protein 44-like n=1 Tax=Notolabrus celidotus TaxID=1203425 RepID=UPI00148F8A14
MGGGQSTPSPSPSPPRPRPPPPSPCLSQPWRALLGSSKENLSFMKSYQPRNQEVQHLRILLHGPVGAGKSSFINSVESTLRGQISQRASTDATSGSSFTLT